MTHHPILAINRLTHFYHSLMDVNGYGVGGSGYGTNICCYGMGVGCDGVCVQSQLGLGRELSVTTNQELI